MWSIRGTLIANDQFESFVPLEILDDYDGPRIFTLNDHDGHLHLACWSDEHNGHARYVVVPTAAETIDALRGGTISVLDALNQPRCWVCDVTSQGKILSCQRVEFDDLPRDALPAPGAMLARECD